MSLSKKLLFMLIFLLVIPMTTTSTITSATTINTTVTNQTTTSISTIGEYNSCAEAYKIECDQTIRRSTLQGDSDYFKFTLPTEKKVRILLNSIIKDNKFGDYDIFANWDGTCPDVGRYYPNECSLEGGYDCGPCSSEKEEECTETLKTGTYYFLIYNYKSEGFSYDISLICSDLTSVTTTSTTIAPINKSSICSINTDCCEKFKDSWVTCSNGICIQCAPNLVDCSYCPIETTTTTIIVGRQRVLMNLITALKNPMFIILVFIAILVMLAVFKFMTKRVKETQMPDEEKEEEILVRIFSK